MMDRLTKMPVKIPFFVAAAFVVIFGFWEHCLGGLPGDKASIPNAGRPARDILFVIDNSGSMKKNDPKFITKDVVTNFSKNLGENSRLGMVIFDQDARLVEPLTEKSDAEANAAFVKNLDKVTYRGLYTNSPVGIERAIYELRIHGRDDAQKVIVFLTDGLVDTGDKTQDMEKEKWLREDLAGESKKAGIRIFGIAFTEKADVHLIQTLALKTGGEYFRAYQATDIPNIFERINEIISAPPMETPPSPAPASQGVAELQPPSESPPSDGYKSTPSQESGSAPDQYPLRWFVAIVVLASLGIIIFIKYFKEKPKDHLLQDRLAGDKSFSSGELVPEARLIDVKNVSSKGSAPLVLKKGRVTIGRDPGNDIVIPEKTVSSAHATIEYKDGYFYLEDHRSTNGTYLNKKKIAQDKPVKLKSGDKIFFATHLFRFLMLDQVPLGETIMLQSSILPMGTMNLPKTVSEEDEDDSYIFKDCLDAHLQRIKDLGSNYQSFVEQHFTDHIVAILVSKAKEIMARTQADLNEHSTTLAKPPVLFYLFTLPVEIEHAQTWFSNRHGGYIKFLTETLDSEDFKMPGLTTLCLISFGRTEKAWVSITIVSSERDSEMIEIMSVEFLSEQERQSLAVDFGELGRAV